MFNALAERRMKMGIRTDIAVELLNGGDGRCSDVAVDEQKLGNITVTRTEILTDSAEKRIGKPKGKYITIESEESLGFTDASEIRTLLADELKELIGVDRKNILVVGVGNLTVTPDALGPKAASGILATRHIGAELAKTIGLKGLRPVAVLSPGVLGQTGIELLEIVEGAVKKIGADTVVLIDALAAREISRLGKTVQLSNTGVVPGSGVGNSHLELSRSTLGVDCVTVGVPTVVDASTLCYDMMGVSSRSQEPFIVTQRDIDIIIEKSSKIISDALNIALQPEIDRELLMLCV